ncbi:hypothetical protein [Streptomyces carminius]|uniref:hypothetical protein n=1 Tax=Streptomyces carminius TaxID=2665496 RepID=UPI001E63A57F|nr:hypothetical protein [Streptomyces carminius]
MLTDADAEDAEGDGVPRPEGAGGAGWCAWVTGDCWLWCGRTGTAVTWLGPVISWGTHAPLYACEDCIRRLEEQVRTPPAHRTAACWLWCGREGVPVTLLAEVEHQDGTAVFHACDECIGRLKQRVLALALGKDAAER